MIYIFLSPHFDDAVYSCGGIIWELIQQGSDVEIWTICAGEPRDSGLSSFAQTLHQRWGVGAGEGVRIRRKEDILAAKILGVKRREFPIPDCIYRHSSGGKYYYQSEESLFGGLHPDEIELAAELAGQMCAAIPRRARLISPLGVGNHVDHQLTRRAAEACEKKLWYYAEVPYVFRQSGWSQHYLQGFRTAKKIAISEAGLQAWVEAAAAYATQRSTFWADKTELSAALEAWRNALAGGRLWMKHPAVTPA